MEEKRKEKKGIVTTSYEEKETTSQKEREREKIPLSSSRTVNCFIHISSHLQQRLPDWLTLRPSTNQIERHSYGPSTHTSGELGVAGPTTGQVDLTRPDLTITQPSSASVSPSVVRE